MTLAASAGAKRRINSPPRKAMIPKPLTFDTVSHALSWFF